MVLTCGTQTHVHISTGVLQMQRDDGDDECDAADAIVGFEAVQFGS